MRGKVRGALSGQLAGGGHVVHKVVDVQRVAARENAGDLGHELPVADGTAGVPVERDAERLRQLVFRDETDGHDQCVAVDALLRAGDGAHGLVDLRDLHAREPVCAEHARDRVAQVQRDVVVV